MTQLWEIYLLCSELNVIPLTTSSSWLSLWKCLQQSGSRFINDNEFWSASDSSVLLLSQLDESSDTSLSLCSQFSLWSWVLSLSVVLDDVTMSLWSFILSLSEGPDRILSLLCCLPCLYRKREYWGCLEEPVFCFFAANTILSLYLLFQTVKILFAHYKTPK